jgi:SAM-dependent methyltransferase
VTPANRAARADWNGESGLRWIEQANQRDRLLSDVATVLLEAADLQAAEVVLDVGCGCGTTTIAANSRVGPQGAVLGIDISEVMLTVARQRVTDLALDNVTFTEADAQTHPFAPAHNDIALSRFGTMFFDDPAAAFTNIRRSLRPGGRLCMTTWQPLAGNDWLTVPGAALLQFGQLPDVSEHGPGMFAQSDPAVLTGLLQAAGFTDIDVRAVTVPLHLGANEDEAAAYLASTSMGRAVLVTVPGDQQEAALDAVREALTPHLTSDGIVLSGGVLVSTARSFGPG